MPSKSRKTIVIFLAVLSAIIIYGLFVIMLIKISVYPELRIVPRDYKKIQDAIDAASDGDIIYVEAGIYRESLVINKPLILIGEDPKRTLIDGEARDYTVLVKGEDIVITGLTITGGGIEAGIAGRGTGLEVHGASNVLILGNHFTGNRMAIYVHSSSNILIIKNLIYSNREGIYLTKSNHIIISENDLMDNPHFGIHLAYSKANRIVRNLILGGANGIYLYDGANENEISENVVKGSGMLIINSHSNEVIENLFTDKGIFVSSSYANIIFGNRVNDKPIIYLEGAAEEVIEGAGQVILVSCEKITLKEINASSAGVGIELWKTNNSEVIKSKLMGNDVAIYVHSSSNNSVLKSSITDNSIGLLLSSSYNNSVSESIFASNLFGIVLRDSRDNVINNNLIADSLNSGIFLLNSSRNNIDENLFLNNSKDVESLTLDRVKERYRAGDVAQQGL